MHYVAVAPLAVSRRDTYTYRTPSRVPAGTIVSIPYAGRASLGVVIAPAEPDERAKTATPTEERLPGWQLRFGRSLAESYLAPLGPTFTLFLPKWRGKPAPRVDSKRQSPGISLRTEAVPTFAKASYQTLVLVPERVMLRRFSAKGRYFSATMPIAARREIWEHIRTGTARMIFGTRSALFLPWKDLGRIVVLHEDELGHQNERTPRFHAREAGRLLAEAHGAELVLASPAPSLRGWSLAGRPRCAPFDIPSPTLATPRYERFEDPLPHGFIDRLGDLSGTVLVHTVQGKVRAVRDAIKAKTSPGIMVGGQDAALSNRRYDHVVTLGIDAILSRQGYAVTERSVALLRKLGGLVKPGGTFLIFSRHQDHPAFDALAQPFENFLRTELAERKALSLPPARPLIRITTEPSERSKIDDTLKAANIAGRNIRFSEDAGKLHVHVKGNPAALRALITPERRIGVEY